MWSTFLKCMKFEYICKKFTNIGIYSYPNFLLVQIFEYIRILTFIYSYSNIEYSAKIFEYSNIFEYSLRSVWPIRAVDIVDNNRRHGWLLEQLIVDTAY